LVDVKAKLCGRPETQRELRVENEQCPHCSYVAEYVRVPTSEEVSVCWVEVEGRGVRRVKIELLPSEKGAQTLVLLCEPDSWPPGLGWSLGARHSSVSH